MPDKKSTPKKSFAAQVNQKFDEARAVDPPKDQSGGDKQTAYRVGKYIRRSYPLPEETIDQIDQVAKEYGISQSQLVRHLLKWALDQVQSGEYMLPIKTKPTLE